MTLRSRLTLAFSYVVLTIIIALEVPLALNLQRRALAELTTQALVQAQTVASSVADRLDDERRLDGLVRRFARDPQGREVRRVIVVDEGGSLLADSAGTGLIGSPYATVQRPEIVTALNERVADSRVDDSETLDQEILAIAVPILEEGELRGAVRISESTEGIRANVRRAMLGLIAVGAAALLAGIVVAFVIAGALARPLARLAGTAKRFGGGDLATRAETETGPPETQEVGRAFNEMAARVQATVRAQREFTANASHQLRTPLTGIKLRLESAAAKTDDEGVVRDLKAADAEVDRLAGIVQRLLVIARKTESGESHHVDIDDAARRAVERWRDRAARAGASLVVEADGATALCDEQDVDQILDNLVENAITYAPGPIRIRTDRSDGTVRVAVADEGPGVDPAEIDRIGERFYRGRNAPAGGSGLGLAIVGELAQAWGGEVGIDSGPGGTTVEIRLPAPSS